MASEMLQQGIGLKIGPLMVQGDFKKWSKEVGAAAGAMGIPILALGSAQIGQGNYRSIMNEAGKGRIVVVKDSKNSDVLLFKIVSDSLRSGVKQEKSPDEQDGWDKLDDKEKVRQLLNWKKSAEDQKEEKILLKIDTKMGLDQSHEVDTDFGLIRYASGDQRYVDNGMAFFDMVTGIVENDKERRARLTIWEVMAKSLVGAEVSTICKMCPIHGDIAYVYTKVREWAESVNPFHYFTSVKNYFTKIYDDWPTVESLVFDVTQAAEELDRMGAALKVKPWATGLKRETVITQLLLRFQNDPEEFKYLNETVLRLWEEQSKDHSVPLFTAEKLASIYAQRATQIRDMKAASGLGSSPAVGIPLANVAQDPSSSSDDGGNGGGGDPAAKVDQKALVAALNAMGITKRTRKPTPPQQKLPKRGNIRELIGEELSIYCMGKKICMGFQAGRCYFQDCIFEHRIVTKEEMDSTMHPHGSPSADVQQAKAPPGGAPMTRVFPASALCTRCKGTKCGNVCYTVMCAKCGLAGHHYLECSGTQPKAMAAIVEDVGDVLEKGDMGYLQYDFTGGSGGYNGQIVGEFSSEGDDQLAVMSTLALVTEEDPDALASGEEMDYNGQVIEEFSGEGDEEMGVDLVAGEDQSPSELDTGTKGGQDMPTMDMSLDDIMNLPRPQFERYLQDVSGPDISLPEMMELPQAEFYERIESAKRKDSLRKLYSAIWTVGSVGKQSDTTQIVGGAMGKLGIGTRVSENSREGTTKGKAKKGGSNTRVSKNRVSKNRGKGTTREKGKGKKRRRGHLDTRIVQATKYLLEKHTRGHVVVEIGKVVHHPECGELRKDGTRFTGLTPQEMEKGRVKILERKRGGRPMTITTIPQEGIHAILEMGCSEGKRLYPRCNCRSLISGYLAPVDLTQDGADGEQLDRSLVGLGEEFCEEMKKVDLSVILGSFGDLPSSEGLLLSGEPSTDAVSSSKGQLSMTEIPEGVIVLAEPPSEEKVLLEANASEEGVPLEANGTEASSEEMTQPTSKAKRGWGKRTVSSQVG